MKTTRFDSADILTWEPIIDDDTQQAMNDMSDIAYVVDKGRKPFVYVGEGRRPLSYAGDLKGATGPVGLYIYTMEDDDWMYVAHMIRAVKEGGWEVEHQCFLFRHRKGEIRG